MTAERARSAGARRPAHTAAEAERSAEVLDELVELGLGALAVGAVVVTVGLVDLVLEVEEALLVAASGLAVDHLAGGRLLDPSAREVETVDLPVRSAQQPGQIGHALGVADGDGAAPEGDAPDVALPHERPLLGRRSRWRRRMSDAGSLLPEGGGEPGPGEEHGVADRQRSGPHRPEADPLVAGAVEQVHRRQGQRGRLQRLPCRVPEVVEDGGHVVQRRTELGDLAPSDRSLQSGGDVPGRAHRVAAVEPGQGERLQRRRGARGVAAALRRLQHLGERGLGGRRVHADEQVGGDRLDPQTVEVEAVRLDLPAYPSGHVEGGLDVAELGQQLGAEHVQHDGIDAGAPRLAGSLLGEAERAAQVAGGGGAQRRDPSQLERDVRRAPWPGHRLGGERDRGSGPSPQVAARHRGRGCPVPPSVTVSRPPTEHPLGRLADLLDLTLVGELAQRGAEGEGPVGTGVVVEAPPQRREDVLAQPGDDGGRHRFPPLPALAVERPGHAGDVVDEPLRGPLQLSARLQPLHGEGPQEGELTEAGGRAGPVDHEQRRVHEGVEPSEGLGLRCRRLAGDRMGGGQVEGAVEHGEAVERDAVGVVEHGVAPLDRGAQAAMALDPPEPGTAPQVEVAEAGQHVPGSHGPAAGGGDLDGQGHAVERGAQGAHGVEAVLVDLDGGRSRTFEEQAHGRDVRIDGAGSGQHQRAEDDERLAGQADGGAAGGEHAWRCARRKERVHRLGHAVEDVLAVVEDDEGGLLARRAEQGGQRREAELARHRRADLLGSVDAGEVDHVAAERELGLQPARRRGGHARLADPAGADHGDEAVPADALAEEVELVVPADDVHRSEPA